MVPKKRHTEFGQFGVCWFNKQIFSASGLSGYDLRKIFISVLFRFYTIDSDSIILNQNTSQYRLTSINSYANIRLYQHTNIYRIILNSKNYEHFFLIIFGNNSFLLEWLQFSGFYRLIHCILHIIMIFMARWRFNFLIFNFETVALYLVIALLGRNKFMTLQKTGTECNLKETIPGWKRRAYR